MSASEQQISDLQTELIGYADEIRTQLNLSAAKNTSIQQKMESIENLKSGLLNTVLSERFEINNKLKYTNDTQRNIRFNELAADIDYQTALAQYYALEEEKKSHEAEAEHQRKKYRATELLMLFRANNPPAA